MSAAEDPAVHERAKRRAGASWRSTKTSSPPGSSPAPYSQESAAGNELFRRGSFPPEQTRHPRRHLARKQPVSADPAYYWLIDLNANPSIAGDNRTAYLFTRLHSPEAQPVRLETGSDDGLKVWLNGEVILANNALRGCRRGADVVPANLQAGWNELLLKVTNNGGGWAACLRVRAPDGSQLEDVEAKAELE